MLEKIKSHPLRSGKPVIQIPRLMSGDLQWLDQQVLSFLGAHL